MKSRHIYIALAIAFALVLLGTFSLNTSHIMIDGEEISGIGGFTGFILACVLAFVAVFLALSVTGIVLAVVSLVLVVVVAGVLGSVAFALLPLLIPFLILYALISLFTRRKAT